MARKATKSSAEPAIDPEKEYRVKLACAVKRGDIWLRPRDDVRMKGRVITELGDCIESFEPV